MAEQSTCGRLVQEESKSEGAVALHVYRAYWRAVGSGLAAAILISLLLMQGEMITGSTLPTHLHRIPRHVVQVFVLDQSPCGIPTELRTVPSIDHSWDKKIPQY